MKKTVAAVVLVLISGLFTTLAVAGDAAAGKLKFAICAGCHGPNGGGNEALKYPKLAGLEADYIEEQLHAFKSGRRDNATMKAMTAGLSDSDMENLAAYIATL